jgi:hypothetical protein
VQVPIEVTPMPTTRLGPDRKPYTAVLPETVVRVSALLDWLQEDPHRSAAELLQALEGDLIEYHSP